MPAAKKPAAPVEPKSDLTLARSVVLAALIARGTPAAAAVENAIALVDKVKD